MSADLPPVPIAFAPREDADSLTVHIRGMRRATWWEWGRATGRDLAMVLALALVVGMCPGDEGGKGPVWALLTEGWSLQAGVPLLLVIALLAGMVLWPAGRRGREGVAHRATWVLARHALLLPDGRELPWHAIDAVVLEGDELCVRPGAGPVAVVHAGEHSRAERDALARRLRAHVEAARVDGAEREALHAAARALAERS